MPRADMGTECKGTVDLERHDDVARVVGQLARSIGATVQMAEPILGPALVERTDAAIC
jgi:hypothetical protein